MKSPKYPSLNSNSKIQKTKKIAFWLFIPSLILFLILLFITPSLIKWQLIDFYQARGADKVNIENVDFNLFTGELALDDFSIQTKGFTDFYAKKIIIKLSWMRLFKEEFIIEQIKTQQVEFTARKLAQSWRIAGIDDWHSQKKTTPWYLKQIILDKLQLENTQLTLVDEQLSNQLKLKSVKLSNLNSRVFALGSELSIQGSLEGADLNMLIQVDSQNFFPRAKINLQLNRAKLVKLNPWLKKIIKFSTGTLDLNLDANLQIKPSLSTEAVFQAKITINDTSAKTTLAEAKSVSSHINTSGNLAYDFAAPNKLTYQAKINSEINQTSLLFKQENTAITMQNLVTQAELHLDSSSKPALTQAKGNVQIGALTASNNENSHSSINLDSLAIANFEYSAKNGFSAKNISTQKLKLSQQYQQPKSLAEQFIRQLSASSSKAQDLSWSQTQGLQIEHLSINTSQLLLTRNQQAWPKPDTLSQCLAKTEKKTPLPFKIKQISLAPGSKIQVIDRNFKPAFDSQIRLDKALVHNIDSSSAESNANFMLAGKLNNYAKFKINGDFKPFDAKLNAKLQAQVNELVLQNYSEYFKAYYGYALTSGHLDYNGKITIKNNKLDSRNELIFTRLGIKAEKSDNPNPYSKKTTLPVNLLNFIASNEKNQIKPLPYKLSLDLCDPVVHISDYFILALTTGIKPAVQFFVRYTNPLGQVITVFQKTTKMINQFKLRHIKFSPGSKFISLRARKDIRKLGSLLTKKPKLTVKLCPRYTKADIQHFLNRSNINRKQAKQQAIELSRIRGSKVKEYLINKMNIESKRLFVCEPKRLQLNNGPNSSHNNDGFNQQDNDDKPRVELYL